MAAEEATMSCERFPEKIYAPEEIIGYCTPLYAAALGGRWEEAKALLDEPADIALSEESLLRILNLAIGCGNLAIKFVGELVNRLSEEQLAKVDEQSGVTALTMAATVGNIEAAKLLVNKNKDLPNVLTTGLLSVHYAAKFGRKEMVIYLLDATQNDVESSTFKGISGAKLLHYLVAAEFFDIAIDLINKDPDMATIGDQDDTASPLCTLAGKTKAFQSGIQYSSPSLLFFTEIRQEIKNYKVRQAMHKSAIELVRCLCSRIMELDELTAKKMLQPSLHRAAKLGISEIVEEIIKMHPPAVWWSDKRNHNVFQIAVMHRQYKVFRLIYRLGDLKYALLSRVDKEGNNILHLAGKAPPTNSMDNVMRAAPWLLNQEELWFKEVKGLMPSYMREQRNKNNKTPSILFKESHKDLEETADRLVKDTTDTCLIVAALVATVGYAAAITVPGGNDSADGTPIFLKNKGETRSRFTGFGSLLAFSLFSSMFTILLFLSLFIPRYLSSKKKRPLPLQLTLGLKSLLFSVLSLIGAFSSVFTLVFFKGPWGQVLSQAGLVPFYIFMYSIFVKLSFDSVAYSREALIRRRLPKVLHSQLFQ